MYGSHHLIHLENRLHSRGVCNCELFLQDCMYKAWNKNKKV